MKEAIHYGAEIAIQCDRCPALIDAVSGDWATMVRNGELYAGNVICWRCKEDERAERLHQHGRVLADQMIVSLAKRLGLEVEADGITWRKPELPDVAIDEQTKGPESE